jgi:hypothetical protein
VCWLSMDLIPTEYLLFQLKSAMRTLLPASAGNGSIGRAAGKLSGNPPPHPASVTVCELGVRKRRAH